MKNDTLHPMALNSTEKSIDMSKMVKLSPLEQMLYDVIDDIDTYDDMAKENFKMFRNLTMQRIKKFHDLKLTFSDGYEVWKKVDSTKTD